MDVWEKRDMLCAEERKAPMETAVTEIRFNSPHAGYGTEIMHNTNPQAAINLLKARVGPDVKILSMKYYTAGSFADPHYSGSDRSGHR